jgi:hypothetical protein
VYGTQRFESKEEDVGEGWTKLHNQKLCNIYVTIIEDGRICWYVCHEREVHRIEEMSCDSLVSVNVHKFKVEKIILVCEGVNWF